MATPFPTAPTSLQNCVEQLSAAEFAYQHGRGLGLGETLSSYALAVGMCAILIKDVGRLLELVDQNETKKSKRDHRLTAARELVRIQIDSLSRLPALKGGAA